VYAWIFRHRVNTPTFHLQTATRDIIKASDINYNECLNNVLQPTLNIPLDDQTLLESTQSIPAGDFIKNVNCTQQQNVKNSLKEWATNYSILQNTLNALLNVLKFDAGLNYLPKDSRSLLQCKSTKITNIRNVKPRGYYYHFGLSAGIIKCSCQIALTDTVKIAVGVDRLPASSSSQFSPILAYIIAHHEHVFPIGIYYGQEKTHNSDEFLKDFISEVILLSTNGININGSKQNK